MSELAPNPGSQLLNRSTGESRVQIPEFPSSLRRTLVTSVAIGIIGQQFDTTEAKPYPEPIVRTPRPENPYKLNLLRPALNDVFILFLECLPNDIESNTLKIGTIIDSLNKMINTLDDCKIETRNLSKQTNPPDPFANLQALEAILIRNLLIIFKKIDQTKIDPTNEVQTQYFEKLQIGLSLLGVSSTTTEANLADMAQQDFLGPGSTRLGKVFTLDRRCINPEHKI